MTKIIGVQVLLEDSICFFSLDDITLSVHNMQLYGVEPDVIVMRPESYVKFLETLDTSSHDVCTVRVNGQELTLVPKMEIPPEDLYVGESSALLTSKDWKEEAKEYRKRLIELSKAKGKS